MGGTVQSKIKVVETYSETSLSKKILQSELLDDYLTLEGFWEATVALLKKAPSDGNIKSFKVTDYSESFFQVHKDQHFPTPFFPPCLLQSYTVDKERGVLLEEVADAGSGHLLDLGIVRIRSSPLRVEGCRQALGFKPRQSDALTALPLKWLLRSVLGRDVEVRPDAPSISLPLPLVGSAISETLEEFKDAKDLWEATQTQLKTQEFNPVCKSAEVKHLFDGEDVEVFEVTTLNDKDKLMSELNIQSETDVYSIQRYSVSKRVLAFREVSMTQEYLGLATTYTVIHEKPLCVERWAHPADLPRTGQVEAGLLAFFIDQCIEYVGVGK